MATLTLRLAHQAQLQESSPTLNLNETGALDVVACAPVRASGTNRLRAILMFDLATLPAGAVVSAAVLTLSYHTTSAGSARVIAIHLINQAVVHTQVTWNIYSTGNNWTLAGGDFNAAKATVTVPSPDIQAAYDWDVLSLVTDWDAATVADFIVKYDDETPVANEEEHFDGYNAPVVAKPTLVLTYADITISRGHIWVEGVDLHYIDVNGTERVSTGTLGGATGALAGHLWVEGNVLRYIDSTGAERGITGTLGGATGALAGHIWVESATLRYIDSSGAERGFTGT